MCGIVNCPRCYANRKGRSSFAGHRYYRAKYVPILPYWSHYVKRPTERPTTGDDGATTISSGCLGKLPLLVEHLGTQKYEDGSSRETSTLSVFTEDGGLRVALNDRDNRRSLYVSADSLEGCLKALEAMLADDRAAWRAWKTGGKKK